MAILDIRTGKPLTRRDALKGGLAAIISAGCAPALVGAANGGGCQHRGMAARMSAAGAKRKLTGTTIHLVGITAGTEIPDPMFRARSGTLSIDWGDGDRMTNVSASTAHTFRRGGDVDIIVKGDLNIATTESAWPFLRNSDGNALDVCTSIEQTDESSAMSMGYRAFGNLTNLKAFQAHAISSSSYGSTWFYGGTLESFSVESFSGYFSYDIFSSTGINHTLKSLRHGTLTSGFSWYKRDTPQVLESVDLPMLTTFDGYCMLPSTIKTVNLPSLTYLNETLNSSQLVELDLPSLLTISNYGLNYLTSLKVLNVPNCTYVGDQGMQNCTAIETLRLPKATAVGGRVLEGSSNLKYIYLPVCEDIGEDYNCTFANNKYVEVVYAPSCSKMAGLSFSHSWRCKRIYLGELTTVGESAIIYLGRLNETSVTSTDPRAEVFVKNTMASVQAIANFPFGVNNGRIDSLYDGNTYSQIPIYCSDGKLVWNRTGSWSGTWIETPYVSTSDLPANGDSHYTYTVGAAQYRWNDATEIYEIV